MICNNNAFPKARLAGKTQNGGQDSAYPSARALSQAMIARLTGKPQ